MNDSHLEGRDPVGGLTEVVLGEEPLDAILELVCYHGRDAIPHADALSVTVADERGIRTAAYTDSKAKEVDDIQYELDEGPCVDATRTGEVFEVKSMRREDRWPRYAPRAAEDGVCSSLSLPLRVRDRPIGALNVYSWTEDAFDDDDRDAGPRFARQAAVLLANAAAFHRQNELTAQLREAVASREVVGKAIGILMEREALTEEEAFTMLRVASQNSNVKLRDIAEELFDMTQKRAAPAPEGDDAG